MPSTGVPSSNSSGAHFGAPASDTLFGPPERMIPTGVFSLIFSSGVLNGTISEYTDSSRSRRAINCVYCDPKSRTRMVWWFKEQACAERYGDPWSGRAFALSDTWSMEPKGLALSDTEIQGVEGYYSGVRMGRTTRC